MIPTRGRIGRNAYAEFLAERGIATKPWDEMTEVQRMGWQCAAKAIADDISIVEVREREVADKLRRRAKDGHQTRKAGE